MCYSPTLSTGVLPADCPIVLGVARFGPAREGGNDISELSISCF